MKPRTKILSVSALIFIWLFFGGAGLFELLLEIPQARAADTGWANPSATGEDYNEWANPTNAYTSNDSYAVTEDGERQDWYNFNFSIPAGATINGIQVDVEGNDSWLDTGAAIELSWDGGLSYTSTGYYHIWGTAFDEYYSFGGAADTWGRSWSDSELTNANFRVRLTGDCAWVYEFDVDHIRAMVYYTSSPQYDQDSFRARNDNGNETDSTWTAAANTNWTQMVDKNFRVRFLVQETAGIADSDKTFQLEYSLNSGTWTDVTGSSSVIKAAPTAYVTDGVDIAQQLGSGTFITPNAGFDEANGQVGGTSLDFSGSDEVELEFSLQIVGADVSNGDSIELRVKGLDTYTNTPTITVTGAGTFLYKKQITLDQVTCGGDLSNFPVLIELTGTDFSEVADDVDADGYDIIFKDSTETYVLDHEIEEYDETTNNRLVAWVRIPTLSSSATTTIYIYYGNSAVTAATENPTGMWDSDYAGVWHLKEEQTGVGNPNLYQDSTENNNDGDDQVSAADQDGQIDGGQQFNGTSDYIDVSDHSSLNFGTGDFTVQAWIKSTQAQEQDEYPKILEKLVDGPKQGYRLVLYSSTDSPYPIFDVYSGGTGAGADFSSNIRDGLWHHVVGVKTSNQVQIYVDGAPGNSDAHTLDTTSTSADLHFARSVPWDSDYFEGNLDEVRVLNVARDQCWIETEHTNQDTPTSFYTVDSQESATASLTQIHYRWRNDDGGESDGTTPDFKIQHGNTTIADLSTTNTLTAGVDYTAPSSASKAFVHIVSTRLSAAGNTTGGGTQTPDNSMAWIDDTNPITSSIVFERGGSTGDTRITYEIIEYIGSAGGANEIVVREAAEINTTTATATTSAISGISNDNDVVVFITGQGTSAITSADMDRGLFTSEWLPATDQAQFTRGDGTDTGYVSYAVVEFTGSNWRNVQREEHGYTAAATWEYETIDTTLLDIGKTFIHVQTRSTTGNLDEQSGEVYLPSTTQVAFYLESGASLNPTNVVWIMENTQSDANAISVARYNGTRSAGAEPYYENLTIGAVSNMDTTSIWGESARSTGTGTAAPRGNLGLELTATNTVELFASDNGQTQNYRYEIVQWPSSTSTSAAGFAEQEDQPLTGLAMDTNIRVRFQVSNDGTGKVNFTRLLIKVSGC
jgi:hypothetical protein